ncbi:hypothetical protein CS344_20245 [Bordetella bronchiseptica]|uniref:hypothetical protein n=1 Tax=Bordetella bronchiseptica TaxID=518 RepID=UPI000FDCB2BA|nr:hypothetical protein [Bordetella bronchiseptica]AZW14244.1 hypothetical protein CS344_20245 [Bordetella bronchiseptica]QBS70779.1 hypothetical protein B2C13_19935 [Bordetella bronchiseptica]
MHNLKAIRRMPIDKLNIYQHALLAVADEMLHVRRFANDVRTTSWKKEPFFRESRHLQAAAVEARLHATLFAFSSPIIWMMGNEVYQEFDDLMEACFNEANFLTSDAYLLGEQQ